MGAGWELEGCGGGLEVETGEGSQSRRGTRRDARGREFTEDWRDGGRTPGSLSGAWGFTGKVTARPLEYQYGRNQECGSLRANQRIRREVPAPMRENGMESEEHA